MRVLVGGEAFYRHSRSGITRYFTELIAQFERQPALGVEAVTPYRFVANQHLTEAFPGRYRRIPVPPRSRDPLFPLASSRAMHGAAPSLDLIHHTLYERAALDYAPSLARVCSVYDFTYELHPEIFPGNTEIAGLVEEKNQFLSHCDGLVCISESTLKDLQLCRPDLDVPVEVTPLGVAGAFFMDNRRPVRDIPRPYLLHVGNRHAHKNVTLLFRAFGRLLRQHPDLHLVLCGNSLAAERQQLADLGIIDRTVCVRVSDPELPALYANATAFVFPSRYEGFGLPIAEAMATGCPVIMSAIPAHLELAGGVALSFDPDDEDALAGHIERVVGDRAERDRLAASGRFRAREFSWRRTADATAAAYARILREQ